jgi:hypothetical protein
MNRGTPGGADEAPGRAPCEERVFDHFILTRFNLRIAYADGHPGLQASWLEHRFDWFDRFCFPSVCSQSNQDFKWVVYFDSETPGEFASRIEDYRRFPAFRPVFIDGYSESAIRDSISELRTPGCDYLITTRLDNDDAIHKDFVRGIQEGFQHQAFEIVSFPRGYVWQDGRIYSTRHASSPFASLIERVSDERQPAFRTILWKPHGELRTIDGFRTMEGPPMWLQVVHDRNVSNRVTGIRTPVTVLADGFPSLATGLTEREVAWLFHLDRWRSLMAMLGRAVRERIRTNVSSA